MVVDTVDLATDKTVQTVTLAARGCLARLVGAITSDPWAAAGPAVRVGLPPSARDYRIGAKARPIGLIACN